MEKIIFEDLPSTKTPLNAKNLNEVQTNVENAITENTNAINEVNDKFNYSTEEQLIGTWIDGKPLYRRIVEAGSLPNSEELRIDANIENIDKVLNLSGIAISFDNGNVFPIPYIHTNYIELVYIGPDKQFRITTNSDRSSLTGYIKVEYTKTTD